MNTAFGKYMFDHNQHHLNQISIKYVA